MDPLLDKHGLARFLGVRVSWVEEATAARTLPITWVGRHARYDLRDIDAWLGTTKEYPAELAPVIALATGPRPPAGPVTAPPPAGPATPSKAKAA
ncbi:hypothetical protein AWW66_03525 [Micromonospora rosaria]|uniref:Helix-turn-helix domain-containing protein n=1 Tax=Micromonospora rosaria TaxID=47874 RepID=A0A136PYG5_9ACTN|nr:helix-turn-helix domain-containing protein [Micromonospora rosaria]KXK63397.1 hypothetical protein AWW66_03525 [Micromonospora rosaria]